MPSDADVEIFFLWSNGATPDRVRRSAMRLPLILWSRGLSQFREGDRLTSRSQGFSKLSIRMSKPSSSKQLVLGNGTYWLHALNMTFSALRMVLTMMSSIFLNTLTSSIPYSLKAFLKAVRDHLLPTLSALGSVFATKFGLNLLRE